MVRHCLIFNIIMGKIIQLKRLIDAKLSILVCIVRNVGFFR